MSDDKYYTGSEFPIVSKSEMKRVATLDPIAAAEELDRLRKEVERLNTHSKNAVKDLSDACNEITTLETKLSQVTAQRDKAAYILERAEFVIADYSPAHTSRDLINNYLAEIKSIGGEK